MAAARRDWRTNSIDELALSNHDPDYLISSSSPLKEHSPNRPPRKSASTRKSQSLSLDAPANASTPSRSSRTFRVATPGSQRGAQDSPLKIRVTVEAEPEDAQARSARRSSTRERTVTTKVPIRDGDGGLPPRRRRPGRPRKSDAHLLTAQDDVSALDLVADSIETPTKKPTTLGALDDGAGGRLSDPPKRKRGRPRKSDTQPDSSSLAQDSALDGAVDRRAPRRVRRPPTPAHASLHRDSPSRIASAPALAGAGSPSPDSAAESHHSKPSSHGDELARDDSDYRFDPRSPDDGFLDTDSHGDTASGSPYVTDDDHAGGTNAAARRLSARRSGARNEPVADAARVPDDDGESEGDFNMDDSTEALDRSAYESEGFSMVSMDSLKHYRLQAERDAAREKAAQLSQERATARRQRPGPKANGDGSAYISDGADELQQDPPPSELNDQSFHTRYDDNDEATDGAAYDDRGESRKDGDDAQTDDRPADDYYNGDQGEYNPAEEWEAESDDDQAAATGDDARTDAGFDADYEQRRPRAERQDEQQIPGYDQEDELQPSSAEADGAQVDQSTGTEQGEPSREPSGNGDFAEHGVRPPWEDDLDMQSFDEPPPELTLNDIDAGNGTRPPEQFDRQSPRGTASAGKDAEVVGLERLSPEAGFEANPEDGGNDADEEDQPLETVERPHSDDAAPVRTTTRKVPLLEADSARRSSLRRDPTPAAVRALTPPVAKGSSHSPPPLHSSPMRYPSKKMSPVFRAGSVLQEALSSPPAMATTRKPSSRPPSKSPTEAQQNVFQGFGDTSQMQLRRSITLGEMLAREKSKLQPQTQSPAAPMPATAQATSSSLQVPTATYPKLPVSGDKQESGGRRSSVERIHHNQGQASLAGMKRGADDMSWKPLPLRRNRQQDPSRLQKSYEAISRRPTTPPKSQDLKVAPQSQFLTRQQRQELEYQREREQVIRQAQIAPQTAVISIEEDSAEADARPGVLDKGKQRVSSRDRDGDEIMVDASLASARVHDSPRRKSPLKPSPDQVVSQRLRDASPRPEVQAMPQREPPEQTQSIDDIWQEEADRSIEDSFEGPRRKRQRAEPARSNLGNVRNASQSTRLMTRSTAPAQSLDSQMSRGIPLHTPDLNELLGENDEPMRGKLPRTWRQTETGNKLLYSDETGQTPAKSVGSSWRTGAGEAALDAVPAAFKRAQRSSSQAHEGEQPERHAPAHLPRRKERAERVGSPERRGILASPRKVNEGTPVQSPPKEVRFLEGSRIIRSPLRPVAARADPETLSPPRPADEEEEEEEEEFGYMQDAHGGVDDAMHVDVEQEADEMFERDEELDEGITLYGEHERRHVVGSVSEDDYHDDPPSSPPPHPAPHTSRLQFAKRPSNLPGLFDTFPPATGQAEDQTPRRSPPPRPQAPTPNARPQAPLPSPPSAETSPEPVAMQFASAQSQTSLLTRLASAVSRPFTFAFSSAGPVKQPTWTLNHTLLLSHYLALSRGRYSAGPSLPGEFETSTLPVEVDMLIGRPYRTTAECTGDCAPACPYYRVAGRRWTYTLTEADARVIQLFVQEVLTKGIPLLRGEDGTGTAPVREAVNGFSQPPNWKIDEYGRVRGRIQRRKEAWRADDVALQVFNVRADEWVRRSLVSVLREEEESFGE